MQRKDLLYKSNVTGVTRLPKKPLHICLMKNLFNHSPFKMALLLTLTLGLAPFVPEPHIWGKLKWLTGGAEGMQAMDYFDVLLHGAPWVYLVYVMIGFFSKSKSQGESKPNVIRK